MYYLANVIASYSFIKNHLKYYFGTLFLENNIFPVIFSVTDPMESLNTTYM